MQTIAYQDASGKRAALWPCEGVSPPFRVGGVDDRTSAGAALRRARGGEFLVYAGDYRNARQLLAAMGRRLAGRRHRPPADLSAAWREERGRRLLEHQILSRLLVPFEPDLSIPLFRAPDVRQACLEAWGEVPAAPGLLPLRELLGIVGAHEWRRKGVLVPALGGRVHPHYGVFAPVRGEQVELVAQALDGAERSAAGKLAFDVGTGTGVLAVLLAQRGARVVATDSEPRAVTCARDNVARFGLADRIEVVLADLFPPGRADLVVSNPPWIPGEPHSLLDRAVYDPQGAMLSRLLAGLRERLLPGGEGWLVLSDLAELLGLRPRAWLPEALERAGLAVRSTRSARPSHPRASDKSDPLHAARSRETTSLYCLVASG
jgi:SAM-dependent methyltransferase